MLFRIGSLVGLLALAACTDTKPTAGDSGTTEIPTGETDTTDTIDTTDTTDTTVPTDPLLDSDGDGLLDTEEDALGTDPNDEDTDGDGLLDKQEVDDTRLDPLKPDSDGDGVGDAEELDLGTDPSRTDTDADGLKDGEELTAQTDPLDKDTDNDAVGDGEEADVGGDPLDSDTDDDGLPDGYELSLGTPVDQADGDVDGLNDGQELIEGTDPLDADTDADGLDDGDELALGANPLDPDTDGGSLLDGDEIGIGTNLLDPDDDVCDWPDVPFTSSAAPGVATIDPGWFTIELDGLFDGQILQDYRADTDGDGLAEDLSGIVRVQLWDRTPLPLCTIEYDATTALAQSSSTWPTDSGGTVFDRFTLTLDPALGFTDCGPLDLAQWGYTDARTIFEGTAYEVGLGELAGLAAPLEAAVVGGGLDWAGDWEPYVYASYISLDGQRGTESGYVFSSLAQCDVVLDDGATPPNPLPAPAPVTGVGRTLVQSASFGPLSDLDPPLYCDDYPEVDYLPSGAPVGMMTPAFMATYWYGTYDDIDGNWHDWKYDIDADGVVDDVPATLQFNIYDAGSNLLCVIAWDLDTAVPADTTGWTAFDPATGVESGAEIYEGWQITLRAADAFSNCARVSAMVYGTNDLRNIFDNAVFSFGVGEPVGLDTSISAVLGAAVFASDYEPFITAQYGTFGDGTTSWELQAQMGREMEQCEIVDPGLAPTPAFTAAPTPDGFYEAVYLYGTWGL